MNLKLSTNSTIKEVKISFAIYLVALSIISGGHYTILNFQTSLYVEDGLGPTALTVLFAVTLVSALVASSTFLKFSNVRIGLLFWDLSALIYIAVNFYGVSYTLIPGSVICGIGKALFWICSGSYTSYYTKSFARCGSKTFEYYSNRCSGYLFAAFTAAQIIGNVLSYIVFEAGTPTSSENYENVTALMFKSNETMSTVSPLPSLSVSEICGAKDCQDPSVTQQVISNYVPPSRITLYIILSVFTALTFLGYLMHFFFVPDKTISEPVGVPPERRLHKEAHANEAFTDEDVADSKSVEKNSDDINLSQELNPIRSKLSEIKEELFLTLRHFIKAEQLLLAGLQINTGITKSFFLGEVTRAYVSCVYGISQVGVCSAIYNSVLFVVCLLNGKLTGKFGRKYSIIFGFICNAATYVFCLVWIPTEDSSVWIIYGLFCVCGIHDAIWLTVTTAAVVSFFPDDSIRAFTWWTVSLAFANMITFAWSTFLCMNVKIYIVMALLCWAVITHMIAEHRHRRSVKKIPKDQPRT